MALIEERIQYGPSGQYTAYVARPQRVQGALPTILVLQEIWGVDEHIKDVTRRFAGAGYVAVAPDLYAHHGERPAALTADRVNSVKSVLDELPPTAWGNPDERDAALNRYEEPVRSQLKETFGTLFGGLPRLRFPEQLLHTTAFLRQDYEPSRGQAIGSVGFCMGGALSGALATSDGELKAAVIFYGNAPQTETLSAINCPVLGFYGSLDGRITDAVPAFADAMKAADKSFEYHVYTGAHHAFFNDTRPSYNVSAARDAFWRTLAFVHDQLGG